MNYAKGDFAVAKLRKIHLHFPKRDAQRLRLPPVGIRNRKKNGHNED